MGIILGKGCMEDIYGPFGSKWLNLIALVIAVAIPLISGLVALVYH